MASPDPPGQKILKAKKTMPTSCRKQIHTLHKSGNIELLKTVDKNNVHGGNQQLNTDVIHMKNESSDVKSFLLDLRRKGILPQEKEMCPQNLAITLKTVKSNSKMNFVNKQVIDPNSGPSETENSCKKFYIQDLRDSQQTSCGSEQKINEKRFSFEQVKVNLNLKPTSSPSGPLNGLIDKSDYILGNSVEKAFNDIGNGKENNQVGSRLDVTSLSESHVSQQNEAISVVNSNSHLMFNKTSDLKKMIQARKDTSDILKTQEYNQTDLSNTIDCGNTVSTCHSSFDTNGSSTSKKRVLSGNKENVKRMKISNEVNENICIVGKESSLFEQVKCLIQQEVCVINYKVFDHKLKELNERVDKTQCRKKHEAIAIELLKKISKLDKCIKAALTLQKIGLESNIPACKVTKSKTVILNKNQAERDNPSMKLTSLNMKSSRPSERSIDEAKQKNNVTSDCVEVVSESKNTDVMLISEENDHLKAPVTSTTVIMSSKKVNDTTQKKRKLVRTTIEQKKEIIMKYEHGSCVSKLSAEYKMPRTTVSSIVKNKEAIKGASVARGVKAVTRQRSQTLEEVEKLLYIWINEKQLAGDSISEALICKKAKQLHTDLLKDKPGTSDDSSKVFKASHGWYNKFKKRIGILSMVRHGETATANKKAAETFVGEFRDYVKAEGFIPQQVFNCDETGLFWKKMPNKTYITQEEKALPRHKLMKDRLTLLLCGNASGDLKLKPLLVYYNENPHVFKGENVIKSKLSVMWRTNRKAWVTRQFFIEWMNEVFGPSVKKYLQEKELPLKALLIMDSAPAHPPGLENDLLEEFNFITVKFLPPNTTPLLQPMDQQIISNFKKLYTKALFQKCFEVTSDTELTLREFWKDHFNILHCVTLIDKAWHTVSYKTMNSAWRKLWSEAVTPRDFEGIGADLSPVVEDIVSLGKSMGLEVSDEDIEELVKEHREELSTEELQELQREQQQIVAEKLSSDVGKMVLANSNDSVGSKTKSQASREKRKLEDLVIDLTEEATSVEVLELPVATKENLKEKNLVAQDSTQVTESFEHLPSLPELPQNPLLTGSSDTLPPQKFELRLKQVLKPKGIALTWNTSHINPRCAPVESYHLYVCHDNTLNKSKITWKKIGEIKALPLPMACTLSQFLSSGSYYFTLQAKDIYGRYGPFCDIKYVHRFSKDKDP
ncbi:activating transcription factor 7-interacting protein 2 isoform X1 [Antechinus flavipes]|uniref:activating transcription factor 7-interacting protein 2 isoform X1 n=1 Tax=Antechinus flavipes TaxID=38775 RepID=UPI002236B974|nr:activating transcription factor 7-interacting protein 2 isoform X1 [Antechinus flavipes]XP_051819421.1 activating transcription factor 7-interacting protein 2 isoform X1 [Antechinus flavipes]XP_051819430.1 activating transcription factor 7-interacting protein 2 isoform X1 [Antechinus flavipes]XP_051819438.1 activating transcription factor 7-interacting protein 2 isoform X1 [Antechinus flavipes]